MSMARFALSVLIAALASTPAFTRPAAPSENKWVEYRIAKDENLYLIAQRYLLREGDHRTLQKLNHIRAPRSIPPGTVLHIPVKLLKSEPLTARIIAFRGKVSANNAPLSVGTGVANGQVLQTGADSFLTIELSNGSRITLPSLSRVRIITMRRYVLGNKLDFDFMVEQGRIETTVTPMPDGQGQYRIRTPIAVSAVRGTVFRVGYEGAGTPSLTEVLDGTVAVNAPAKQAVAIPKGFGAGVAATGRVTKEALLPPPTPLAPGKIQMDPLVSVSVAPIDGAKAYHLQIARDAGFTDIQAEATSSSPALQFEAIDNGRWFVRATAIAHSGLEGMPIVYTMRRALNGLSAQASADANGGWTFKWSGAGGGKRVYHFQLRPDRAGATPMIDEPGLQNDALRLSDLPPGKYQWRVGVRQYLSDDTPIENWLPESALLVSAPSD
jgi:hypothetical protein